MKELQNQDLEMYNSINEIGASTELFRLKDDGYSVNVVLNDYSYKVVSNSEGYVLHTPSPFIDYSIVQNARDVTQLIIADAGDKA